MALNKITNKKQLGDNTPLGNTETTVAEYNKVVSAHNALEETVNALPKPLTTLKMALNLPNNNSGWNMVADDEYDFNFQTLYGIILSETEFQNMYTCEVFISGDAGDTVYKLDTPFSPTTDRGGIKSINRSGLYLYAGGVGSFFRVGSNFDSIQTVRGYVYITYLKD